MPKKINYYKMKYIKLFENIVDPFDEENWDDDDKPVDYVSIYMSFYSIIISENIVSKEKGDFVYFDSTSEKDIPYKKDILNKKEIFIDDRESSEWLIKVDSRDEIGKYKNFIEKCINDNLNKYIKKNSFEFKLNDGFYIYPLDIEINMKEFNQFIDKYFFKK